MIKDYDFDKFENPYKGFKRSKLGNKLAKLQRLVNNLDIPVLIIVDGWESSGKGYVINDLIRELDPRLHKVSVFENPTDEERARPFLWRFWSKIPKKGNVAIFDRSFYFDVMNNPSMSADEVEHYMNDIISIEKNLYDDNTIIIKFFLHISEETQQKRIDDLRTDEYRSFLISKNDETQYSNYEKYLSHFDKILKLSNFDHSPWNIVSSENLKSASKKVLGLSLDSIRDGIDRYMGLKNGGIRCDRHCKNEKRPLEKVDLSLSIGDDDYDAELKKLQKQVRNISYELYTKQISSVIVFEGMDAGGKGGAIQRLTRTMDPRGYEVVPISAPDETEKQYHYLWRFFNSMPKLGNMVIFDRSWYGRVLVERVEEFASVNEWNRAFEEINSMERHLCNSNMLVLKFFLYIDKDEQLVRFEERQSQPDKIYKITEEDWRNREKWDSYMESTNEMLARTDTKCAPWIIVEGNSKKYARIKILREFIKHARNIIPD